MTLEEIFRDPPSEYRPAPFWFWNHRLEKGMLELQIAQMKEKGLGGFVMHARHGLETPYLSDEWFECIRFCSEKARVLGMVAWAYDERDWPSGPAGGRVIADPANRMSYIRFVEEQVEGPATMAFGPDVVCAYVAGPGKTLQRVDGDEWAVPEGAWRVAKAVRFECPAILWLESYLDTLNPNACGVFIRSTYDLYEEKLGGLRELGLAGFFTDEPALSTYPDDLTRIPWTDAFPDAFLEIKNYDLLDKLPDLFSPGESGAQVRYDYWDVATRLFENAFFKPIHDWCEQRGLKLIGHPLGEEPLFFQFRCIGNIFPYLKHMHMPGMDHLTITVGKGAPLAMTPKLIASAALLAGRERTMSETFGESGWQLSLREMKWMADWQMANGINYFIPHAFYYSVAGRRKKDSPPSEFFQAPYWPRYREFADYLARTTAVLTGGEHVAKIALLYPMSSICADFVPGNDVPEGVQAVEQAFAPLGEMLLGIHRDFVLLDEADFVNAEARGDGFRVNGLEFRALVLPKLTTLREGTVAALRRVAGACPVVAVGARRIRVLDSASDEHPRERPAFDLCDIAGVQVLDEATPGALAAALAGVTPDVVIDGNPDLYYLHRRKEGRDFFFFANTSLEPVDALASLEVVGLAETWDAETGEVRAAPGQRIVNDRLEAPLHLAGGGSCLLSVDRARAPAEVPDIQFAPAQRIKLCDLWAFTPENGNFLLLNKWEMSVSTRHHYTAMRYSVQFVTMDSLANMRIILDGVPKWPTNVPESARPIVAQETECVVQIDEHPITDELPWEIDPHFRVLSLAGLCEPGLHRLDVIIKNSGWFPQPGLEEYAWLGGDFVLDQEASPDPQLERPRGILKGPWEDQGYPYFSGTGTYYTDIELDEAVVGKRVFLEAGDVGHLLEVEVNNTPVGVRAWPPYRVEVTDPIRKGPNLFVLKVTNSAQNFFEGPNKDRPSGLLDDVWLEIADA